MKALIVIDVQNGVYADEDGEVHAGAAMVAAINGLIAAARAAGCPVVFVQHEDEEWLASGSPQWELVGELDARRETDLFVSKRHGSAFHGSGLEQTLRRAGVDEIVVCGLQTEFCVDSTVRHAVTLDLAAVLAEDAHSTWDTATLTASQIVEHHNRTLASYVRVVASDAIVFAAQADAKAGQVEPAE